MKKLGLSLIATLAFITLAKAEPAWLTNLETAQSKAKEENKMVLIDFSGSDWCPPCQALHKRVLSSKEFEDFAKENLILVLVDFPHHKKLPPDQQKANQALSDKFNIKYLPTVIVLDGSGKKLNRQDGDEGTSAQAFVANLQKLKSKS
jgi:thiol-disulfide isomerase/thioredoxin